LDEKDTEWVRGFVFQPPNSQQPPHCRDQCRRRWARLQGGIGLILRRAALCERATLAFAAGRNQLASSSTYGRRNVGRLVKIGKHPDSSRWTPKRIERIAEGFFMCLTHDQVA